MDWLFDMLFAPILPSDEVISWLFETYCWLLQEKGPQALSATRLITPTDDNFPIRSTEGDPLGQEVFALVKQHAGMQDWPCRAELVEVKENPIDKMGALIGHHSSSGAAGTFHISEAEQQAVIRFSSDQLEDVHSLIGTFAHELSHFYLSVVTTEPPGGRVAEEPATDITAIFLGFGIFITNSAFKFEHTSGVSTSGFRTSQQGYLGEPTLAFALAIYSELKQIPPKLVQRHLKTNPRAYHRHALKDIKRRWGAQMNALKATAAR
ncbi:MAG TPA: hypothetical protein VGP72_30020 [Planctomycetota bacterium]|jgi:hypothetical protein